MAYGTFYKSGEGSEAERGSRIAGAGCWLARSDAKPFPYVPVVGTPGLSLSAGGLRARWASPSGGGHDAHHPEDSTAHRRAAAEVCQKQRPDDGRNRNRRAPRVPANKEEAWLSCVLDAACLKSTLNMPLIACSSPSSPRPTPFWFLRASVPWGA